MVFKHSFKIIIDARRRRSHRLDGVSSAVDIGVELGLVSGAVTAIGMGNISGTSSLG